MPRGKKKPLYIIRKSVGKRLGAPGRHPQRCFLKIFLVVWFFFIFLLNSLADYPVSVNADWKSGWANRVRLLIDNDLIDDDLTDIPVLIYISELSGTNEADLTSVFDELGSNSKKIAVTTDDGETDCYVEIEEWDDTGEEAWLWVKVPHISSTSPTELFLYYDNGQPDNTNYVGDPGSNAAKDVWDDSFVGVWHKDDVTTSTVRDSTSYENDGTKRAANEPLQVDGIMGKAQSYDGSNDYITISDSAELRLKDDFNISVWLKVDSGANAYQPFVSKHQDRYEVAADFRGLVDGVNRYYGLAWRSHSSGWPHSFPDFFDGYKGDWVHVVVRGTERATDILVEAYRNGEFFGSRSEAKMTTGSESLSIGRRTGSSFWFDGLIDEVRLSDVTRSTAWIKTEYLTGVDKLIAYDPAVFTMEATNVTFSSARLNGELSNLQEEASVYVWFKWRETGTVTWQETGQVTETETGDFHSDINGLDPGTAYEFIAFTSATGGDKERSGTRYVFTTLDTPVNISPGDGSVDLLLTPDLEGSALPSAADHQSSQWQITVDAGNYTAPVFDTGTDSTNLTGITIPSGTLSGSTTYYWHVRYNVGGVWSDYSQETLFTTVDDTVTVTVDPNSVSFGNLTRGEIGEMLEDELTVNVVSRAYNYSMSFYGTNLNDTHHIGNYIPINNMDYRFNGADWDTVSGPLETDSLEIITDGVLTGTDGEDYLFEFRLTIPADAIVSLYEGNIIFDITTVTTP